jgi:hypothetical protein
MEVPMFKGINIVPIEDGGNPRTEFEITKNRDGFFVHPFSEDDDSNYRFRLKVKVVNDLVETVQVPVNIQWGDIEEQDCRTSLYLSQKEDQWEVISGNIDGSIFRVILDIPPGESILSSHPSYGFERFKQLAGSLRKDRFSIKVIGKSRRNRDIVIIEAGNRDLRPISVMPRVHPYETIGSYIVDGMIKWINSDKNDVEDFLSNNHVIFIPMPNPDGVAEGTCKRTLGGYDFMPKRDGLGTTEPEPASIRDFFYDVKPIALLELHGWMIHDYDLIKTFDTQRGKELYAIFLENKRLFNKSIEVMYRPSTGGLKSILTCIAEKINMAHFLIDSSWDGRNAQDTYDMGVYMLKALTKLF